MAVSDATRSFDREVDVVVIGSGVAGMTAAIVSATRGLEALIVEKTAHVGGTAARAVGAIWIVDSTPMREAGIADSTERALTYFDQTVGNSASRELQDAYIKQGRVALDYLLQHSELEVDPISYPDYMPQLEGSSFGRFHAPRAYDGRLLGDRFADLGRPLGIYTLFGGMMLDDEDMGHFLSARRSFKSMRHAVKRMARYAKDRLRYPRGTRLVLGNALIARLYKTVLDRKIEVWREASASTLITDGGRVIGVKIARAGKSLHVRARRGVVIATGGYAGNLQMRSQNERTQIAESTVGLETNTGDGIKLAEAVGATLDTTSPTDAWFVPISVLQDANGAKTLWPHFVLDRAKPGVIAVDGRGNRFVNEADSYHDFVKGMRKAAINECWLVCDSAFVARYGLGIIPPGAPSLSRYRKAGYLFSADTPEKLASAIGVNPINLSKHIARHNEFAKTGVDLDFGKGSTAYNQFQGDPNVSPNPCIGPIAKAPFHAIRVFRGNFGTSRGLKTSTKGEVLDRSGRPIPGLYACGNDMNSPVGGEYIGPGITLGPAITFGYLAGRALAGNI